MYTLNYTVVEAPKLVSLPSHMKMFLAGTIDMGNSVDWQAQLIKDLRKKNPDNLTPETKITDTFDTVAYNPRRKDWDKGWSQTYEHPEFNQQVNWELSNIEGADVVVFNFLPDSQSPITLLELGLCAAGAKAKRTIVFCPKEFYRSGNVEIVCRRYGVELYQTYAPFVNAIHAKLIKEYEGC